MQQSKLLTCVPRVGAIARYFLRTSLFMVSSARAALANPQVLAVIQVPLPSDSSTTMTSLEVTLVRIRRQVLRCPANLSSRWRKGEGARGAGCLHQPGCGEPDRVEYLRNNRRVRINGAVPGHRSWEEQTNSHNSGAHTHRISGFCVTSSSSHRFGTESSPNRDLIFGCLVSGAGVRNCCKPGGRLES